MTQQGDNSAEALALVEQLKAERDFAQGKRQAFAPGFLEALSQQSHENTASLLGELKEYAKDPGAWEKIQAGARGLASGVVSGTGMMLGDFPERAGTLISRGLLNIADHLGMDVPRDEHGEIILPEHDTGFTFDIPKLIQRGTQAATEALKPEDLRLQDSGAFRYSEMAGVSAPVIAGAAFGNPAIGAVLGGTQIGGMTAEDAARGGASSKAQLGALAAGTLLGSVLTAPLEMALGRISTQTGGRLIAGLTNAGERISNPLARIATAAAGEAAVRTGEGIVAGAAAGAAFTTLTNAIHDWATDDDISLFQNIGEGAGFGAVLGGVLRAATEAAIAKRRITGRHYTSQGWTGELLGEESGVTGAARIVNKRGRVISVEQGMPREGFPIPEESGGGNVDPEFTRRIQQQAAEEFGAQSEAEIQKQAEARGYKRSAEPFEGQRIEIGGVKRNAMELPQEYVGPRYNEYGIEIKPEEGYSEGQRIEVGRRRGDPMRIEQEYVGPRYNEAGVEIRPEEGYGEGQAVQVIRGRGAAQPEYVGEPGTEVPTTSLIYGAPAQQPDYSQVEADMRRAMNPVYDPVGNRTFVTDIGLLDAEGNLTGGTGLRVTLDDTYDPKAKPILRADVIAATERAVKALGDFAFRYRLVPKEFSGFFDPQKRIARLARYGAMLTAAHEAGHAIETVAYGTDASPALDSRWPLIEGELTKLGKVLYPDSIPAGGHVSEGFAEFAKLWLAQHEDLARLAPETTRWFEQTFLKKHADFGRGMDEARERFDQYRYQGSEKRTRVIETPTWRERFSRIAPSEIIHWFKTAWIESSQILYNMRVDAGERGYEPEAGTTAYEKVVALRGTADAIHHQFVFDSTYRYDRTETGESLQKVLEPMNGKARIADLKRYVGLRATEWRMTKKYKTVTENGVEKRVLAHEEGPYPGVDVRHQIAALEAKYPQIRGVADGVMAWYDRVIEYVVSIHPELRPVFDSLRGDGEFYMPLKRWADWYEQKFTRKGTARKTEARKTNVAKRSKGSPREILDPMASLQIESLNLIQRAHELAIMKTTNENAELWGMYDQVNDVTNDVARVAKARAELDVLAAPFKPGDKTSAAAGPLIDFQAFITGALNKDSPDGPIVQFRRPIVREDGTPGYEVRWLQYTPEMYKAVISVEPKELQLGLGFVGTIARNLRWMFVMGATGARASWGLIVNPTRDAASLYVNSRYNPHLLPMLFQLANEHIRVGLHEFTGGKLPYKWAEIYDRLGLAHTGRYGSFRASSALVEKAGRTHMGRNVHTLTSPSEWIDVLARLSGVTEKGTRIWELKRSAEAVGWKPGMPMTPEQATKMAVDARQVTIDFFAGGHISQQINQFVPFFNVMFQGPRATARAAKQNTLHFMLATGTLAFWRVLNWWRNKDEDWMLALSPYERATGAWIPTTNVDGTKDLWKIPIAPDVGLIPLLFEMMGDGAYSQNPIKFNEWFGAVANSMTTDALPPLAREWIEQSTNRAQFGMFGSSARQIIPEDEANAEKEGRITAAQQYGTYTGSFSVAVGQALGISPRRVEHALKGMFAGSGQTLSDVNVFGIARPVERPGEPSDWPVIGVLARRGGAISQSSRWITELYDIAPKAQGAFQLNPNEQTGAMKSLMEEATQAISFGSTLLEEAQLDRKQRQDIMEAMNSVARDAVEQSRKADVARPEYAGRIAGEFKQRVRQNRFDRGLHP